MKFELTSSEFQSFCAQLSNGTAFVRVQELEAALKEARDERDQSWDERHRIERENYRLNEEVMGLRRMNDHSSVEIRELRRQVAEMQDKLVPHRVERAYSRAFAFKLVGNNIPAIKEIRTVAGIGLKEAKQVVEGTLMDDLNYPDLALLSSIFRDLGKDSHDMDLQCKRLATLVSAPDVPLVSILTGTFHIEAEAAAA